MEILGEYLGNIHRIYCRSFDNFCGMFLSAAEKKTIAENFNIAGALGK